jgi:hypothetical protein
MSSPNPLKSGDYVFELKLLEDVKTYNKLDVGDGGLGGSLPEAPHEPKT